MIQKLLFGILKYLSFDRAGRVGEEAEIKFSNNDPALDLLEQGMRTGTWILESRVPGRCIGLAGRWLKNVYVKLDEGRRRVKM